MNKGDVNWKEGNSKSLIFLTVELSDRNLFSFWLQQQLFINQPSKKPHFHQASTYVLFHTHVHNHFVVATTNWCKWSSDFEATMLDWVGKKKKKKDLQRDPRLKYRSFWGGGHSTKDKLFLSKTLTWHHYILYRCVMDKRKYM